MKILPYLSVEKFNGDLPKMNEEKGYNAAKQDELKESILRIVNCMTQDLIDLQDAVVQLESFKGPKTVEVIKEVEIEVEVIKEVEVEVEVIKEVEVGKEPEVVKEAIRSPNLKPLTPFIIDDFYSFNTDILSVNIEGNLVTIEYTKSGQIARLNREELYSIFVNLPDKFDKGTVAECLNKMGIEVKTKTLLMQFFLVQFKDYCEKVSKRSKVKLVIQKL